MTQPMLANAVDIEDLEKRCKDYCMEPKLDGVRVIVLKKGDRLTMTSRSGKQDFAPKVPGLAEALAGMQGDFCIDGELGYVEGTTTYPIIDFNKTMRVLGSAPDEAIRKYKLNDGIIELVAFDMLMRQGVWFLNEEDRWRRRALKEFRDDQPGFYVPFTIVERFHTFQDKYYHEYVERGGEGVMLKNPIAPYVPGKRPARAWYKLKKFETVDVVIDSEYLPGQGKYKGLVGAVYFGYWRPRQEFLDNPKHTGITHDFVRVGKCSGMDDARRRDMTLNWSAYAGRVMEIRYFGKVGLPRNGLRHPQFVRMRPDRDPLSVEAP